MRWTTRTLWLGITAAVLLVSCAGPGPRAFVGHPLATGWRIAVFPLANYTTSRDAPDRLAPMLSVELARVGGIEVVEAGRVEDVLSRDPWIMTDRLPADLVTSFASDLEADALLVGSVLAYGYVATDGGDKSPQVSLSLRLLTAPEGRVIWSAVHSRDGGDAETVFGFGKITALEKLAAETVREIMATLPPVSANSVGSGPLAGEGN